MYYTLLLKTEIISFFLKRSMHLKRTYILRRHKEVIIVLWLQGLLQYLIPVHFLEAFQAHCRHFAIVPHSCLFPKNRTEYINSINHSLLMKQVNLVPWGVLKTETWLTVSHTCRVLYATPCSPTSCKRPPQYVNI